MTRLNDALREWAADAPPLGDIADRAIAQSRLRRRRVWTRTVPLGAAAVLTAVAVLVAGLWGSWIGGDRDGLPVVNGGRLMEIQMPIRPPDPLPAAGVGPAAVGYVSGCSDADGPRERRCNGWRIVTTEGTQWTVENAYPPHRWGLNAGGLAISPDGEQLAFIRRDRALVIRDLGSGDVRTLLRVPESSLQLESVSLAWSPDMQRLAVSYASGADRVRASEQSVLIDLTTDPATKQAVDCCVLGLPEGDRPPLLYTSVGPPAVRFKFRLYEPGSQSYERKRMVVPPIADLEQRVLISPDGRTLAAIVGVPDKSAEGSEYVATLQLVDLDKGRVSRRHALIPELSETLEGGWPLAVVDGWADDRTVLLGQPMQVYAVDTYTGHARQRIQFSEPPILVSLAVQLF